MLLFIIDLFVEVKHVLLLQVEFHVYMFDPTKSIQ